jgi:hypothetical protein
MTGAASGVAANGAGVEGRAPRAGEAERSRAPGGSDFSSALGWAACDDRETLPRTTPGRRPPSCAAGRGGSALGRVCWVPAAGAAVAFSAAALARAAFSPPALSVAALSAAALLAFAWSRAACWALASAAAARSADALSAALSPAAGSDDDARSEATPLSEARPPSDGAPREEVGAEAAALDDGTGDSERRRRLLSQTGVKNPLNRSNSPTLKLFAGLLDSMSSRSSVVIEARLEGETRSVPRFLPM